MSGRAARAVVDQSLRVFLKEARIRLEAASAVIKAAETCAEAGDSGRAVALANDVDDPVRDADRLIGMAATLLRLSQDEGGPTELGG